jgi:hypothetical protein
MGAHRRGEGEREGEAGGAPRGCCRGAMGLCFRPWGELPLRAVLCGPVRAVRALCSCVRERNSRRKEEGEEKEKRKEKKKRKKYEKFLNLENF